jgi:hypothetical protein
MKEKKKELEEISTAVARYYDSLTDEELPKTGHGASSRRCSFQP